MTLVKEGSESEFQYDFLSSEITQNTVFFIETTDSLGRKHFGPVGAPQRVYTFSGEGEWMPIPNPASFAVEPNFPNPFNQHTAIGFEIPQSAQVSVSVLDVRGREKVVLFRKTMEPGKAVVRWNGCDRDGHPLPSGVYLAVIRMRNEMRVVKMTLLR